MPKENTKVRIDYIDLMKGVCITLVVIVHCDVQFPSDTLNNMLQNLRMPLYFFLTGIFFKEYHSFGEFLIKKTNKIIIPYIFFAFIPYLFYDLFYCTNIQKTGMYYFFMLIEPYNFPLWFLRSLFISYLLYYFIHKSMENMNKWIMAGAIIILSFISWKCSFYLPNGGWSFLLDNFITSIFALPFIFVASKAREKGLLTVNLTLKKYLIVFFIGLIAWCTCAQDNVFFFKAHLGETYPLLYISAFGGITCLWIICSKIKKIVFLSYLGRYSIVVLGTFAPTIRLLSKLGITGITQSAITLAIMPLMIYLCIHLFPHFTAQKDLFKVKG